jgi:hypothetical protein
LFSVFIPFGGTVIGLVSYLVTAETDEDRVGFTLVSVVAGISPVSKILHLCHEILYYLS